MAGELFVVGMGPGDVSGMTLEAHDALARCELIVGYTAYLELVAEAFPQAELLSTPMRHELQRCRLAHEHATRGRIVGLVCSGDAGVYGMASPVLELADEFPDVPITIVAGVTAAQSGSAVLGAPLGHDYAVVSLSDLLTPWQLIENRLEAAAAADFCLCLYNPRSSKRTEHLRRAAEVLLRHKAPETVCGWVRNIGRAGEESGIMTLAGLGSLQADMFTTVFVGNSATRVVEGRMVTPRGYEVGA